MTKKSYPSSFSSVQALYHLSKKTFTPSGIPPASSQAINKLCSLLGVIFVHDLSQKRTKTDLQKWAAEIATTGMFSAPLGSGGSGGLPVPYIVIGNTADIATKEGT